MLSSTILMPTTNLLHISYVSTTKKSTPRFMWETTRRTTPWLKIPLINTMFSPQDLWLDSTDIGVPYIYTLVLDDFTCIYLHLSSRCSASVFRPAKKT